MRQRARSMKVLQLTTIIRDVQTATMTAQTFTRAPVRVGRQYGNQLRLDARIVSRRHGAFLFSKDGLRYIDYHSANGTAVDGVRIEPNRAVDIRDSSVITIAPYQIVVHLDLVELGRVANDPDASTPVTIFEGVAAVRRSVSPRDAIEIARRATAVIEILAERLLAAGSRRAATSSPLRLATSPDEMVALLLDPADADQRAAELRALLAELLRPRLTSIP
ncbi:MAG TPA: FHA domain-containing protein [Polyangia bacterium]|nr:FHA domain-containing protein [Polyangia bacterium]